MVLHYLREQENTKFGKETRHYAYCNDVKRPRARSYRLGAQVALETAGYANRWRKQNKD
jgi:hypothetical protein